MPQFSTSHLHLLFGRAWVDGRESWSGDVVCGTRLGALDRGTCATCTHGQCSCRRRRGAAEADVLSEQACASQVADCDMKSAAKLTRALRILAGFSQWIPPGCSHTSRLAYNEVSDLRGCPRVGLRRSLPVEDGSGPAVRCRPSIEGHAST